ncbi:putative uncharacterized transporter C323.07c [[Candida] railenensis]|uniref:Uncharacterized transporter C323.07c n=1 Tax=[Candida] railenensis TaxID=45579 RepID=A0A9P0QN25_9ASCO|nr:putative uncharacterized transporter C323.07c [[Candida] railenensis]
MDENSPLIRKNESNTPIEMKAVCKSSVPLIITFFLQYSLTVVSIFSVGHIGKTELAAVSLAIMTFNVTVSIFNGMATCLDTFCAQAYGAKKYHLVGLYFQKCAAMLLVMSIPIIVLWCFSGSILSLVVEEKELAYLAQRYLRVISMGSPGYIFFETGKRFLQAQGLFNAGQYCLFIVAPINVLLNYVLVWDKTIGIGFIGAPIATAISYWLMSGLLLCYVLFVDGKRCWDGLEIKKSFQGWGPMMKLALNGTAMLLSEFIAFEILTLAAARFGTASLAAQSIVSTMATLFFQVPFGVSVAVSTRMGNHIGGERIDAAQIVNKVAVLFAAILGVVDCLILVCGKSLIANSFTSDREVTRIAEKIIVILGINQLYDCANILFAGCLRGQGRQQIGSKLNLIAYYILAVPLGLTFAFVLKMELVGLWAGLGVGIFTLAVSEAYFVFSSNWDTIALDSKARNSIH